MLSCLLRCGGLRSRGLTSKQGNAFHGFRREHQSTRCGSLCLNITQHAWSLHVSRKIPGECDKVPTVVAQATVAPQLLLATQCLPSASHHLSTDVNTKPTEPVFLDTE